MDIQTALAETNQLDEMFDSIYSEYSQHFDSLSYEMRAFTPMERALIQQAPRNMNMHPSRDPIQFKNGFAGLAAHFNAAFIFLKHEIGTGIFGREKKAYLVLFITVDDWKKSNVGTFKSFDSAMRGIIKFRAQNGL